MNDDQLALALMVCLFRVAERINPNMPVRGIEEHIDNARAILARVRESSGIKPRPEDVPR